GGGRTGRVRVHQDRVLRLQTLVALHALLGVVLGLALLPRELDAVDSAVPLVDEREVVGESVGDRDPAGRVGPGAVDEERDEDAAARREPGPGERPRREGDGDDDDQHASEIHGTLRVSGETATDEASPW